VEFPAVPRDRPLQVRCLHFPAFWGSKRGYWQQSAEFKPLSPLDKAFHADMDRVQVPAPKGHTWVILNSHTALSVWFARFWDPPLVRVILPCASCGRQSPSRTPTGAPKGERGYPRMPFDRFP
jgi:hypothetical protein